MRGRCGWWWTGGRNKERKGVNLGPAATRSRRAWQRKPPEGYPAPAMTTAERSTSAVESYLGNKSGENEALSRDHPSTKL